MRIILICSSSLLPPVHLLSSFPFPLPFAPSPVRPHTQVLCLGECGLTDATTVPLGQALQLKTSQLRSVLLHDNKVGSATLIAFAEACRTNTTLHTLDMYAMEWGVLDCIRLSSFSASYSSTPSSSCFLSFVFSS